MSINKVILVGNVGKDPEVRRFESGTAVATITLATSERRKDANGEQKEFTEWHTVVAWRQLADLAENFIRKGSQIYVEGKLRTRNWDDQNGQKHYATEIQADVIQLLGRRNETGGAQQGGYAASAAPVQNHAATDARPQQQTPLVSPSELTDDGTDDLPF